MAIHFETIKEKIDKFDMLANQVDMTKPSTVLMKNCEKLSVAERMKNFFDIADGKNPEWNV